MLVYYKTNSTYREKCCWFYSNIDTVEVFHSWHDKVALLTRRCSERGTSNSQHRKNKFYKGLDQIYTKLRSKDEFLMTLTKLRLGFLFTNLSQHFRIYLVAFTLNLFIPE